jgi:hypothetical protein
VPTVAIDTAVTADLTTAQTLTNKTLTSPVLTTPSISNINAKGDILVGTADNTLGVITAGSNGDILVVDSSTSSGLRYQGNFTAGKNAIINGDMRIWQRGTTFNSIVNGGISADRWKIGRDGSNTINVTQQTFTPGAAPVAGYEGQFFARASIASTGTLTFLQFSQCIEDVRNFAGQTITVSFWAKGSATATGLVYAAQNFGSGGSATVEFGYPEFSLTTSWQRFTVQLTVPSVSGKTIGNSSFLEIYIRGGLTANGSTYDIWGVQVEAGSVATAFETATGTIGGELALCQRYFEILDTVNQNDWIGDYYSTTNIYAPIFWKVTKRNTPTLTLPSVGSFIIWNAGASLTPSSVGTDTLTTNGGSIYGITSARTAGSAGRFRLGSNTISVSAEL